MPNKVVWSNESQSRVLWLDKSSKMDWFLRHLDDGTIELVSEDGKVSVTCRHQDLQSVLKWTEFYGA